MTSLFLTPLKRLITRLLQSTLSKYIKNIQLEGMGVIGGELILQDLELRLDVIQDMLDIPVMFKVTRGFIKELRIFIPWTQILYQPIQVKVHTIEIILTAITTESAAARELRLRSLSTASSEPPLPSYDDGAGQTPNLGGGESTTGVPSWLQNYLSKVLANVSVEIADMVLKYEHNDVVLALAVGSLKLYSADPHCGWDADWQEPIGSKQALFKAVIAQDLTILLDRYNFGPRGAQYRSDRRVDGLENALLRKACVVVRARVCLKPTGDDQEEDLAVPVSEEEDPTHPKPSVPTQPAVAGTHEAPLLQGAAWSWVDEAPWSEGSVDSTEEDRIRDHSPSPVPPVLHSDSDVEPIAVADVHVDNMHVSLSERQILMLVEMAQVPKLLESVADEHLVDGAETDHSASSKLECKHEGGSVNIAQPAIVMREEEHQEATKSEQPDSAGGGALRSPIASVGSTESSAGEEGWVGWAWGMVVGEEEDASEVSYDAASTKSQEASTPASLTEPPVQHVMRPTLVVAGLRVTSASLSLFSHIHQKSPALSPESSQFGSPPASPSFITLSPPPTPLTAPSVSSRATLFSHPVVPISPLQLPSCRQSDSDVAVATAAAAAARVLRSSSDPAQLQQHLPSLFAVPVAISEQTVDSAGAMVTTHHIEYKNVGSSPPRNSSPTGSPRLNAALVISEEDGGKEGGVVPSSYPPIVAPSTPSQKSIIIEPDISMTHHYHPTHVHDDKCLSRELRRIMVVSINDLHAEVRNRSSLKLQNAPHQLPTPGSRTPAHGGATPSNQFIGANGFIELFFYINGVEVHADTTGCMRRLSPFGESKNTTNPSVGVSSINRRRLLLWGSSKNQQHANDATSLEPMGSQTSLLERDGSNNSGSSSNSSAEEGQTSDDYRTIESTHHDEPIPPSCFISRMRCLHLLSPMVNQTHHSTDSGVSMVELFIKIPLPAPNKTLCLPPVTPGNPSCSIVSDIKIGPLSVFAYLPAFRSLTSFVESVQPPRFKDQDLPTNDDKMQNAGRELPYVPPLDLRLRMSSGLLWLSSDCGSSLELGDQNGLSSSGGAHFRNLYISVEAIPRPLSPIPITEGSICYSLNVVASIDHIEHVISPLDAPNFELDDASTVHSQLVGYCRNTPGCAGASSFSVALRGLELHLGLVVGGCVMTSDSTLPSLEADKVTSPAPQWERVPIVQADLSVGMIEMCVPASFNHTRQHLYQTYSSNAPQNKVIFGRNTNVPSLQGCCREVGIGLSITSASPQSVQVGAQCSVRSLYINSTPKRPGGIGQSMVIFTSYAHRDEVPLLLLQFEWSELPASLRAILLRHLSLEEELEGVTISPSAVSVLQRRETDDLKPFSIDLEVSRFDIFARPLQQLNAEFSRFEDAGAEESSPSSARRGSLEHFQPTFALSVEPLVQFSLSLSQSSVFLSEKVVARLPSIVVTSRCVSASDSLPNEQVPILAFQYSLEKAYLGCIVQEGSHGAFPSVRPIVCPFGATGSVVFSTNRLSPTTTGGSSQQRYILVAKIELAPVVITLDKL